MRLLTPAELHFRLLFTVQSLDRALIRQLVDKNPVVRDLAVRIVTDRLAERFAVYEVYAPDPVSGSGG